MLVRASARKAHKVGGVYRTIATKANRDYLSPTHLDDTPPQAVLDRLKTYSSVTLQTYARPPLILTKGKRCTVWDTQGREYLDFSAGIAVNALGHADEGVAQVVADQAGILVHCSNLWHNEWSGELALLLVERTKELGGLGFPSPALKGHEKEDSTRQEPDAKISSGLKVFFSNSGTEANEGALKFVRKWGKHVGGDSKTEILSFKDGFHGRSMGALSATWQSKYQAPFAPLVPDFKMGELNDLASLESITEKTCGVIVEPIQGEGGILAADEGFLRALRKKCDDVGALLIYDEIQCGLGRTGDLWAHGGMPVDCHPDVVTMAKPLANGIPIGAILMRDKVANIIKLGDHGTTFGGGPLQTRVAHHVLSRIAEPTFLSDVSVLAANLRERLEVLPTLFPRLIAGPPRGRGLIQGLPFKRDEWATRVLKLARERGVLLLSCGKATIRFVPSLVVTPKEIERCIDVLESSLVVLDREVEGL